MVNRKRSYNKKTEKKPRKKNLRSKKKNSKSIPNYIISSNQLFENKYLRTKESGVLGHPYEDRISKYIDPNKKFILIGLYDGHSGDKTVVETANKFLKYLANRIKKNGVSRTLFKREFVNFNEFLLRPLRSNDGTTVTVLYLDKSKYYISNLGDSPCYLVRNKKIKRISVEHDFDNPKEVQRTLRDNGNINPWAEKRLFGIILASRGFGDFSLKDATDESLSRNMKPRVFSDIPSISKGEIKPGDQYFIITSDGITDPFSQKYLNIKNKMDYRVPVTRQKSQDDNTIINLKECLDFNSMKQTVRNIVNKGVEMCKNDYQDDISVVMLDIKEIKKLLL